MGKKRKRLLVARRAETKRVAGATTIEETPVAETVVTQDEPAPARKATTRIKKKTKKPTARKTRITTDTTV